MIREFLNHLQRELHVQAWHVSAPVDRGDAQGKNIPRYRVLGGDGADLRLLQKYLLFGLDVGDRDQVPASDLLLDRHEVGFDLLRGEEHIDLDHGRRRAGVHQREKRGANAFAWRQRWPRLLGKREDGPFCRCDYLVFVLHEPAAVDGGSVLVELRPDLNTIATPLGRVLEVSNWIESINVLDTLQRMEIDR